MAICKIRFPLERGVINWLVMDLPLGGGRHCPEALRRTGSLKAASGNPVTSSRAPGPVLGAWNTAASGTHRMRPRPQEAHSSEGIKRMTRVNNCKRADVLQDHRTGLRAWPGSCGGLPPEGKAGERPWARESLPPALLRGLGARVAVHGPRGQERLRTQRGADHEGPAEGLGFESGLPDCRNPKAPQPF